MAGSLPDQSSQVCGATMGRNMREGQTDRQTEAETERQTRMETISGMTKNVKLIMQKRISGKEKKIKTCKNVKMSLNVCSFILENII